MHSTFVYTGLFADIKCLMCHLKYLSLTELVSVTGDLGAVSEPAPIDVSFETSVM